jgi:sugar phosphate isomerase/epimerase
MSKKRLPKTGNSQSWPEAGRQTRAALPEEAARRERASIDTAAMTFVVPGHSDLDFESMFRALTRIGYQGPLAIEWADSGMDCDG